jgi:predicted ATPase
MPDFSQLSDNEISNRIAVLRDNLRQLTEQAAAQSGAANEERLANRIEDQSRELDDLLGEQGRREKK